MKDPNELLTEQNQEAEGNCVAITWGEEEAGGDKEPECSTGGRGVKGKPLVAYRTGISVKRGESSYYRPDSIRMSFKIFPL